MRRVIFHTTLAGVLLASAGAAAQIEGFRACASIVDNSGRLACYDAALEAADAEAAARLAEQRRAAELAAAQAAAEAKARQEQERLAAFGAEGTRKREDADEEKIRQISATVAGVSEGANGVTVTLDNGQVWYQTERQPLPMIRPGDEVTIRRGMLGNYRMTFERVRRTISVRRSS